MKRSSRTKRTSRTLSLTDQGRKLLESGQVRLIKERAPEGMDARALSFGTSLYMLGHGGAPVLAGIVGPLLGLRAYFGLNVLLLAAGLALWLRSFARSSAGRG